MQLDELLAQLKQQGISIRKVIHKDSNTPINEFTEDEQYAQCCQPVDVDECADEGKTEPFSHMSQELANELGRDYKTTEQFVREIEAANPGKTIRRVKETLIGPSGNCGEKRTRWTGILSCCDSPPPLLWGIRAGAVERGETYNFSASGGVETAQLLGFSWSVVGQGLTIAGDGLNAQLEVDDCFCDPGLVVVTDSCGQQIITVVYLDGGNDYQDVIADTFYQSDYGWEQDGVGYAGQCAIEGVTTVRGFNGDRTEMSVQGFGQVCYGHPTETEEEQLVALYNLAVAQADYSASGGVSTPTVAGWTKFDSGNVWYMDVSDDPRFGGANYHAYYQNTSSVTYEFTHTCQDNPLEIATSQGVNMPVIADYNDIGLAWLGGDPPFSLALDGVEVYLDSKRTKTELHNYSGHSVPVYAKDSCGSCSLLVTDSCGSSVEIFFKSATGSEQLIYSNPYGGGVQGMSGTQWPYYKAPFEGGCPGIVEYPTSKVFYISNSYDSYYAEWRINIKLNSQQDLSCPHSFYGAYCRSVGPTVQDAVNRCSWCYSLGPTGDPTSLPMESNIHRYMDPLSGCVTAGDTHTRCQTVPDSPMATNGPGIGPEETFHSRWWQIDGDSWEVCPYWVYTGLALYKWVC